LKLLQGLRRYSKKQPSHVSLYLAFQLQYSPVQTATEHFATVLAPYPKRWAVEVYFKEAKQHLGFLKEQSIHYAAYIASIPLVAIRFCMLISAIFNFSIPSYKQQPNISRNYSAAENYRNISLRAVMIFYSPIGSRDSKMS
jgi:hypothetical protein